MRKIFMFVTLLMAVTMASAKQLYICGDAPMGNGWNFNEEHQLALTLADDGITNTFKATLDGQKHFTITDGAGTSWDDFNANHRFGCADFKAESGTYQLSQIQEATFSLPAGEYEISINSETMEMTLTVTLPEVTENKYYVTGSSTEIFGTTWNLSQNSFLTKDTDGVYKWTRENVTLKGGTSFQWKVIENPASGWGTQYGAEGKAGSDAKNITTSVTEDGIYDVTFKLDLSQGDASVPTVELNLVGDAYVDDIYTVVGDQRLTGSNWNPNYTDNDMTFNESTNLYEKTFEDVALEAGQQYGIKVVLNRLWASQEGGKEFGDNGQNYIVSVEQDGTYNVTITLDVAAEQLNHTTSGKTTIIATLKQTSEKNVIYNLAGQRVSTQYQGIAIKDGRKVILK